MFNWKKFREDVASRSEEFLEDSENFYTELVESARREYDYYRDLHYKHLQRKIEQEQKLEIVILERDRRKKNLPNNLPK